MTIILNFQTFLHFVQAHDVNYTPNYMKWDKNDYPQFLNPIQDGMGAKKAFLPIFTLLTSTKVKFLALLPHWSTISSLYLVSVPNYWTLTRAPIKKIDFLVKFL